MSNQRPGKSHAAGLNDRADVSLRSLIDYVKQAHAACEEVGEEDSALRFEMMLDFLQQDVVNGKPFKFSYKSLGL
jgi:hypothetical protein